MVQFGGISLRRYAIPTFSLLYIALGTLSPIWNLRLIGSQGKIAHNFPYPFSLICIDLVFATLIFCALNICERFVVPFVSTQILPKDAAQSVFKVNTVKIDPFTNQTLAFYGGDEIRRPGLFQPIDFNLNPASAFENGNPKMRDAQCGSTLSGVSSQITQFSLGSHTSHTTLSSHYNSAMSHFTNQKLLNNNTPTESISLSIDLWHKSWCFDANFGLKLRLTCKSGLLFGLTQCLCRAASLFVPFSLSVFVHSFVLLLITIYSKVCATEPRTHSVSLIFALLAVVSIVPFCVNPFKGDTLYWDNKSAVNGTEFILISLGCDCMGAIALFLNIISISNLCSAIKPSKMRFENDREPSIVEIAFFIALWALLLSLLPCIVCDFVFHSENILTSHISAAQDSDQSMFELLFETSDILADICISTAVNIISMFSFVACLSIMTALSVAVLFQISTVTLALLYFEFLCAKGTDLQSYDRIALVCAYVWCALYAIVRVSEHKRHSKLNWTQYLTRRNRINSDESFHTLLSNKTGLKTVKPSNIITSKNLKAFSQSLVDSNRNIINEQQSNGKSAQIMIETNESNANDSIFSIASDESLSDENIIIFSQNPSEPNQRLSEDETLIFNNERNDLKFYGPNRHNNRFGLPSYLKTPPKSERERANDLLFHRRLIEGNIKYYQQSQTGKKRKKKKKKRRKINDSKGRTASLNEIDFEKLPSITDVRI